MDETRIRGGHHDSPFIISYFTTWMSSARAIYPIVLFAPSFDLGVVNIKRKKKTGTIDK